MNNTFLIVGLGNPGNQYRDNRHNVGFQFIDYFSNNQDYYLKFNGNFYKKKINNNTIFFAKPLTFMNLSGKFIKAFVDFYKIKIENILLIYDDLDTDFNKVKFKNKGSSGGHNGLKSIFKELGTENIKRIKIGIGRPFDKKNNIINYVLENFNHEQKEQLKFIFSKIEKFIYVFLENNFIGNNCEI